MNRKTPDMVQSLPLKKKMAVLQILSGLDRDSLGSENRDLDPEKQAPKKEKMKNHVLN
jgi:hypothetical protein